MAVQRRRLGYEKRCWGCRCPFCDRLASVMGHHCGWSWRTGFSSSRATSLFCCVFGFGGSESQPRLQLTVVGTAVLVTVSQSSLPGEKGDAFSMKETASVPSVTLQAVVWTRKYMNMDQNEWCRLGDLGEPCRLIYVISLQRFYKTFLRDFVRPIWRAFGLLKNIYPLLSHCIHTHTAPRNEPLI